LKILLDGQVHASLPEFTLISELGHSHAIWVVFGTKLLEQLIQADWSVLKILLDGQLQPSLVEFITISELGHSQVSLEELGINIPTQF
jgi:hypothetical protein